jgi:hypothetical protein
MWGGGLGWGVVILVLRGGILREGVEAFALLRSEVADISEYGGGATSVAQELVGCGAWQLCGERCLDALPLHHGDLIVKGVEALADAIPETTALCDINEIMGGANRAKNTEVPLSGLAIDAPARDQDGIAPRLGV